MIRSSVAENIRYRCRKCEHESLSIPDICPRCQVGVSSDFIAIMVPRSAEERVTTPRSPLVPVSTGLQELDEALGGGMMNRGVGILTGSPGVGKTTMGLQIALHWAESGKGVLYANAEEPTAQFTQKLAVMPLDKYPHAKIFNGTDFPSIETACRQLRPKLLILDPINNLRLPVGPELRSRPGVDGPAGTLAQLKKLIGQLRDLSYDLDCLVICISHASLRPRHGTPRALLPPKLLYEVDFCFAIEPVADPRDAEERPVRVIVEKVRLSRASVETHFLERYSHGFEDQVWKVRETRSGVTVLGEPGRAVAFFVDPESNGYLETEVKISATQKGRRWYVPEGRMQIALLQKKISLLEQAAKVSFGGLTLDIDIEYRPEMDLAILAAAYSLHLGFIFPKTTYFCGEVNPQGFVMPMKISPKALRTIFLDGHPPLFANIPLEETVSDAAKSGTPVFGFSVMQTEHIHQMAMQFSHIHSNRNVGKNIEPRQGGSL